MSEKGDNILSFPQPSKPEQRLLPVLSPAEKELRSLEHESLRNPPDWAREERINELKKQLGK